MQIKTTFPDTDPAGDVVLGSRCSDKKNWHLVSYLKMDEEGHFVKDNTAASHGRIVYKEAVGNNSYTTVKGALNVTSISNFSDLVEAYKVLYDDSATTEPWRVFRYINVVETELNSGVAPGPDIEVVMTQGSDSLGNYWEFSVPNKVGFKIYPKIGAPYNNGNVFYFNTFKKSNFLNEIDLGTYDINTPW